MLDISTITKAVESLLRAGTKGYFITRNEMRNEDPNAAAAVKGWIGITRGSITYGRALVGIARPWEASVEIHVEVQVADMGGGEELEQKLMAAEQEIITVLNADPTLGGTVLRIDGFQVNYDQNQGAAIYHEAAVITLRATARA